MTDMNGLSSVNRWWVFFFLAVLLLPWTVRSGATTQSLIPSIMYDVVDTYRSQCVEDMYASVTQVRIWAEVLRCWEQTPMPMDRALKVHEGFLINMNFHSFSDRYPQVLLSVENLLTDLGAVPSSTSAVGWEWTAVVSEFRFLHRCTWVALQVQDPHFTFGSSAKIFSSPSRRPFTIRSRYLESTATQEFYISGYNTAIFDRIQPAMETHFSTVVGSTDRIALSETTYGYAALKTQLDAAIASGASITHVDGVAVHDWIDSVLPSYGYGEPSAGLMTGITNGFQWRARQWPPHYTFPVETASTTVDDLLARWYPEMTSSSSDSASYSRSYDSRTETFTFADGTTLKTLKLVEVEYDTKLASSCVYWSWAAQSKSQEGQQRPGSPLEGDGDHLLAESQLPEDLPGLEPDERSGSKSIGIRQARRVARRRRQIWDGEDTDEQDDLLSSVTPIKLSSIRDKYTSYLTPAKDVGILEISSFSPGLGVQKSTLLDAFEVLEQLIDQAEAAGTTKLIIDLTGNGGGLVWLVDVTLKVLWPDIFLATAVKDSTTDPLDGRLLPTWPNATQATIIGLGVNVNTDFLNDVSGRNTNSTLGNLLLEEIGALPYHVLVNGSLGHEAPLLRKFRQYLPEVALGSPGGRNTSAWWRQYESHDTTTSVTPGASWFPTPYFTATFGSGKLLGSTPPKGGWKHQFTEVKVLTDGRCGSACSMFETKVRLNVPGATVNTIGGWVDPRQRGSLPMQTSNFCGGGVMDLRCLSNSPGVRYNASSQSQFNANSSLFYPYQGTFNAYVFYSNTSVPILNSKNGKFNTPRQFQNSTGHTHWYFCLPTMEEKILHYFPSSASGASHHTLLSWWVVAAVGISAANLRTL